MAKLIYSIQTSLDGYVNDDQGKFGWAAPDEEVHTFFNELERPVGTHLYGRRMYEMMRYWQDPEDIEAQADHIRDYAEIWQAADKVVYSRTLDSASTPRTRIESEFDPDAVRKMKDVGRRRPQRRRPRTRSRGTPSGAGRPARPGPLPGDRRRRHALAPGRPSPRSRAAGGAPLRRRRGPPPATRRSESVALGRAPRRLRRRFDTRACLSRPQQLATPLRSCRGHEGPRPQTSSL